MDSCACNQPVRSRLRRPLRSPADGGPARIAGRIIWRTDFTIRRKVRGVYLYSPRDPRSTNQYGRLPGGLPESGCRRPVPADPPA